MEELKINVKVTGNDALKDLRASIKQATSEQLAFEEGSEGFNRAAARVAKLKDKLDDVNDAIKTQKGEPIERLASTFGLLKDKVLQLDFSGVIAQLKVIGTVLKENPLFILGGIVVALGAALVLLKDKVKIIGQAFEALVDIGRGVIKFFTDFTDAIGLTTIAQDEASAALVERLDKDQKNREEALKRQIAQQKAAGKETSDLEKQLAQSAVDTARKQREEELKIAENATGDTKKEALKRAEELQKIVDDGNSAIIVAENEHNRKLEEQRAAAAKEAAAKRKAESDRILAIQKAALAQLLSITADNTRAVEDLYDAQDKTGAAALNRALSRELAAAEKQRELAGNTAKATEEFEAAKQSIYDKYSLLNDKRLEDNEKKDIAAADARTALVDKTEREVTRLVLQAELDKNVALAAVALAAAGTPEERIAAEKAFQDAKTAVVVQGLTNQLEAEREKLMADREQGLIDEEAYQAALAEVKLRYDAQVAEARVQKKQETRDMVNKEDLAEAQVYIQIAQAAATAAQGISDAVFANKLANAKKGSKEELELQKKQFKVNKALAITMAAINTAGAVVAMLANPGGIPGIVLAALSAVTGIAQIAVIASKKFPENGAASGGVSAPSLSGGAGAAGGSSAGAGPSPAIAQGRSFDPSGVVNGSRQGAQQPVKVYVTETDITSTQSKVSVIQSKASFP